MTNFITYLSQLQLIQELSVVEEILIDGRGHKQFIDVFVLPLVETGFVEYKFNWGEIHKEWFESLSECIDILRRIREENDVNKR